MKNTVLIAAFAVLGGCAAPSSQTALGKLTLADAQTASGMAKQAGDTKGQACYDFIATEIQGSITTGTCGLLCANEFKRTAVTTETNLGSACGGVLPLVLGL